MVSNAKYYRCEHVREVMDRLEVRRETTLRGIVTPYEVGILCGKIRELLAGNKIWEDEREALTRYTGLFRCFTTGEADRIAAIYGRVMISRKKANERA